MAANQTPGTVEGNDMSVPPTVRSLTRIMEQAVASSSSVRDEFLSEIGIFDGVQEDAIAQAVLTGKASRANDPRQDWQSWIEGAPPLLVALEAEHFIIDAHPVEDEVDFQRRYRCRPHQLRSLVEAFQHRIYINLRSVDRDPATGTATGLEKYISSASRSLIGPVLEAADPNRIYVNAERRVALFDILMGVRGGFDDMVNGIGVHADGLAKAYVAACARIDRVDDGVLARTGDALSPTQLKYRLAYYACYVAFRPDLSDEDIRPMLEAPAEAMGEPAVMLRAVRALNVFHNSFTAPLTGAYGGVYSTRRAEMDAILERSPAAKLGARVREQDRSMCMVLLDTLTGAYPGGSNERRFPRSLCRMAPTTEILSDDQWEVLLESIRINEDALRRKAAFMTAIREVSSGRPSDVGGKLAAYEGAIEDATRRCAPMMKRAMMSAPEVSIDAMKAAIERSKPTGLGLVAGGSVGAGVALIAFGILAKMVSGAAGETLNDVFGAGCGCSPAHREIYDFVQDIRLPR